MSKKKDDGKVTKRQIAAFKSVMKKKAKARKDQKQEVRLIGTNEKTFINRIGTMIAAKHGTAAEKNYHAAVVTNLNQDWNPFDVFSDNVNLSDIYSVDTIRYRARDLQRNTPFVQRYLSLMKTNIVGPKGIQFKSMASDPDGQLDIPDAEAIEAAFKDWSKRGNCSVCKDVNFKEFQMSVIECIARDGEALVRKHKSVDFKYGFKLELIDPGQLNSYENSWESSTNKNIFGGIEMDKYKNPIAYHLGNLQAAGDGAKTEVVPADQMIHLFKKDFPTQVRGISWMACIMEQLHQLTTYTEASVIAAKVAASASAFITSPVSDDLAEDDFGYGSAVSTHLEPGTIGELSPGESISFIDPKHPTTTYSAFVQTLLMHIASGLNVSYSALTGDRTKANNASNRIAVMEEHDGYKVIQNMLIDDFMIPVFEEWLGMALTKKAILSFGNPLPLKYKDKFAKAHFIPRSFPSPDPHKDGQVLIQKLSTGMVSWKQAVVESGGDPEVVVAQIAKDKEMFEAMGLQYPGSGTIQPIVEVVEGIPDDTKDK